MEHLQAYMNCKVEVTTALRDSIGEVSFGKTYQGILRGYDPDANAAIEIQIEITVEDETKTTLQLINWAHVVDVTLL